MSFVERHKSTIIFIIGIAFLTVGLALAIYNVYLFGTANSGLSSSGWAPIGILIGALITAGLTLTLHQGKRSKVQVQSPSASTSGENEHD